jgi:hypothetical protein
MMVFLCNILSGRIGRVDRAIGIGLLITAYLCFPTVNNAQTPEDLSIYAPPPARTLSKEEKDLLTSQGDTKKLTKIALELMEARMKKAEEADSRDDFAGLFIELGAFHGLMDYTLDFLLDKHGDGGKAFKDFKRYELGLRGYTPRLELIRRDLPIRYEYYVRVLIKVLRESRAKAIDPMFGETVVREKN